MYLNSIRNVLFYSLLSLYTATVNSSNKIALTFDTQCITACTGSPNEETSIDQLTSQLINSTIANTQAIKQIVEQVNNLANTLRNATSTVNQVLQLVEELTELHSEPNDISPLPTSCQQIKQRMPNSPSGMYQIEVQNSNNTNTTQYVYCYMEELCGSNEGWTRLAYLNMSDPSVECPSGFRLYESGGVRACGRPVSSGGSCASVKFPSNGIAYSEVCGRVVGYRYKLVDKPGLQFYGINEGIDSYYLDGISLTHGSPREHIWSFLMDYRYPSPHIQPFVGNDYFCENTNDTLLFTIAFEITDPLWDGEDCDEEPPCCDREGLPWFHKVMNTTSSDYIELRVCCDQGTNDEDVPFGLYEIYVKK